MRKTVGMITIYRKNYGAFLQAYALQQSLIAQGFCPEIIRYDYYRDHTVMGIGIDKLKTPVSFCKMLAVEIIKHKAHRRREKVFERSIDTHIIESKAYYRSYKRLENDPPQYDIYITGSDQVFNSNISRQALDARLLNFVRRGKKVSYAASAGKTEIPSADEKRFRQALNSFDFVSVRETGLRDFVEAEYGIPAVQNIDPTLLLSKEQWLNFGKLSPDVHGDYIFYYRIHKQDAVEEKAQYISEKLGIPVYVADGNDRFPNQIMRSKDLSPEEWVGTLAGAKYVVTNSFHGSAFSINLEKRVSIVVPPSGGARITDLLEQCKLKEWMKYDILPECGDEIYVESRNYFKNEREKSVAFFLEIAKEGTK